MFPFKYRETENAWSFLAWWKERERERKGYVIHAGSNPRDATGIEEDPAFPELEII